MKTSPTCLDALYRKGTPCCGGTTSANIKTKGMWTSALFIVRRFSPCLTYPRSAVEADKIRLDRYPRRQVLNEGRFFLFASRTPHLAIAHYKRLAHHFPPASLLRPLLFKLPMTPKSSAGKSSYEQAPGWYRAGTRQCLQIGRADAP